MLLDKKIMSINEVFMKENWLLWLDETHSPFWNMAADELLLNLATTHQKIILRLYFWDRKSASIGFAQRWGIVDDIYTVVRRQTGGGVVYHDVDLTYTLVIPPEHALAKLSTEQCYEQIHLALAQMMGNKTDLLATKLGEVDHSAMACFTSPSRFDVMQGDLKAAGAAQKRSLQGVLHQGSVLLSVTHGNAQALSNLIQNAFSRFFDITYQKWLPTQMQIERVQFIADHKYATELWSFKRKTELKP